MGKILDLIAVAVSKAAMPQRNDKKAVNPKHVKKSKKKK